MPNLPVRQRTDAKIAGVCAALGRAWSIDPLVVRVAFVVLGVLTNGFIVAAYLALWALLPEPGQPSLLRQWFPVTRSWPWPWMVTVVVLVTVTLGGMVSGSGPGAFLILGLAWVILRFGFAGRHTASDPAPPPRPPASPTAFERAAYAWQLRLHNLETGRPADWVPELEQPHGADATHAGRTRVTRRRHRRTWLGILVALGLTWTGLAVVDALGTAIAPLAWTSATLLVLGLALVWTARPGRAAWGRPRLLLPLTVVLSLATAPLLLPAPVSPVPLTIARAPQAVPGSVVALPLGTNTVDLASLPPAEETLQYRLDLGDVTLVVPREGNVVVNAHVDLGDITVPGEGTVDGMDVRRTWTRIDDPAAPTRTIDVRVGLGEIAVTS